MQLTVEIERKRKRKKRKENGELMVNAQRIKKKCRNAMIVRYRGFFFKMREEKKITEYMFMNRRRESEKPTLR